MTLRDSLFLLFRVFVGFFLGLGLLVGGMFFWAVPRGDEPLLQKALILAFVSTWLYMTGALCLHFLLPRRLSEHESPKVPFGKYFGRHFAAAWIAVALLVVVLVLTWPNE